MTNAPQQPGFPPRQPNVPPNWMPQGSPFGPQAPYPFRPGRSPYEQRLVQTAHRRYARAALALVVVMVIWLGLASVLSSAFYRVIYSGTGWGDVALYLITDIPLYGIALPCAVWMMSGIPFVPVRRYRIGGARYFQLLLMAFALMYVGSFIGSMLANLFAPASTDPLESVVGGNVWGDILFAVLLAPIMEEWFFRKQLIGRLRVYGEKTAILFSAAAFALFHTNLYQLFYAFGLGLLFGYVYARTSNLWITISMHMILNFNGAVLAPGIIRMAGGAGSQIVGADGGFTSGIGAIAGLYSLVILAAVVAGVVLLIRDRKRFEFYPAPAQLPAGTGGSAAFGSPAMIAFIVLCCILMMVNLLL